VLVLTGAFDFAQYQAQKPPTRKRLEFMARAYDLLRNDLVFVSPYERAVMAKAGLHPHRSWRGSEHLEQHLLGPDAEHRVGVLLLPPLPEGATSLPPGLVRQVEDAVRSLRTRTRLVVAMSPWGYLREQELLPCRTCCWARALASGLPATSRPRAKPCGCAPLPRASP